MMPFKINEKLLIAFCVCAVVIITAIAFIPSLSNGFVDWDDPHYVTGNDAIRDLSLRNLGKIFTSSFIGCYCPLAISSYAVEYHFAGLNPFVYHLDNYLMHLMATALVFCFIYLLSRKTDIAFLSALLFGIHPLHVESVAWVAERKDLLCAIFYLLALITYLVYLKKKKAQYYYLVFLCMMLSLFSKPMAVTLPLIFMLLDYFNDRKIDKRSVLEKIPFFAVALIFGIGNLYFQAKFGATGLTEGLSFRVYFFLKAIVFYLGKIFAPLNLSAMYPYYHVTPERFSEVKYYIMILLFLFAVVFLSRKYSKKVIFGSAFFIITILPVLKIVPAGEVFVADRYMYLPSIGIFFILAVFVD